MKTLLAISGIFLAIASAITLLVVRAARRNAAGHRQGEGDHVQNHRLEREVGGDRERVVVEESSIAAVAGERSSEEDASRVTALQPVEQEAPKADEEPRTPTRDEAPHEAEAAHVITAADARETAEEKVPQADEGAHTAVHQESARQAEEAACNEAGEALVATAVEALEIPGEEAAQTDEAPPISAQQETARGAGYEARQESEKAPQADELSRTAAEQENERRAEDEADSRAEEIYVATAAEDPKTSGEKASQLDELPLTGTLRESDQHAGDEPCREAEEAPRSDEISRTATQQEREQRADNQTAAGALQGTPEEAFQAGEEHRIPAVQRDALREATDEVRHLLAEQVDTAPAGTTRDRAQEQDAVVADGLTTHRGDAEPEFHLGIDVSRDAEEEAQVDAEADAGLDAVSDFPELPVLGPSPLPVRVPRQYRPPARVPVVAPVSRPRTSTSGEREARDRSWPLGVRLIFEKGGFCRVSLLPRRGPGMPPQVAISGSSDPPVLVELQEEWYQDVILPEMGHLLREGVEWAGALADGQQVRWSLSGREIYVLAPHNELAGFVSVPRMMLGEQHVVLCIPQRLEDVRAAIALTSSPEPELLESGSEVPAGWVALRGVIPHTPVAASAAGDILDALRPLAEIAISLEGGIKIERQTWLSGYPPRIRLRGDTGAIEVVLIDGREASLEDGGYVVPGWDALGDHSVWCTAGSRMYSIREGAEEWEPWDAYRWSQGDTVHTGVEVRPAICGVLVRPPQPARAASHAIEVPITNPVLIGAVPGEIYVCTPRRDINADLCVGFPGFEPVWAMPADALHCDKRRARILLVGKPHPVLLAGRRAPRRRGVQGSRVAEWCAAIRLAGQKGLQTEPPQSDVADLWRAYKQVAKALWRNLR